MIAIPKLLSLKTTAIAAAVAFALGIGFGWYEKGLRVPALLGAQKKADAKACQTEQDKTKGENDALVVARNRVADDLARYKRLHPNTCVYASGKGELQPPAGQHAGLHGIDSDTLRDYAALCETYRSELGICSGQTVND